MDEIKLVKVILRDDIGFSTFCNGTILELFFLEQDIIDIKIPHDPLGLDLDIKAKEEFKDALTQKRIHYSYVDDKYLPFLYAIQNKNDRLYFYQYHLKKLDDLLSSKSNYIELYDTTYVKAIIHDIVDYDGLCFFRIHNKYNEDYYISCDSISYINTYFRDEDLVNHARQSNFKDYTKLDDFNANQTIVYAANGKYFDGRIEKIFKLLNDRVIKSFIYGIHNSKSLDDSNRTFLLELKDAMRVEYFGKPVNSVDYYIVNNDFNFNNVIRLHKGVVFIVFSNTIIYSRDLDQLHIIDDSFMTIVKYRRLQHFAVIDANEAARLWTIKDLGTRSNEFSSYLRNRYNEGDQISMDVHPYTHMFGFVAKIQIFADISFYLVHIPEKGHFYATHNSIKRVSAFFGNNDYQNFVKCACSLSSDEIQLENNGDTEKCQFNTNDKVIYKYNNCQYEATVKRIFKSKSYSNDWLVYCNVNTENIPNDDSMSLVFKQRENTILVESQKLIRLDTNEVKNILPSAIKVEEDHSKNSINITGPSMVNINEDINMEICDSEVANDVKKDDVKFDPPKVLNQKSCNNDCNESVPDDDDIYKILEDDHQKVKKNETMHIDTHIEDVSINEKDKTSFNFEQKDKDIKNELDHGRNLNKNFTTGNKDNVSNAIIKPKSVAEVKKRNRTALNINNVNELRKIAGTHKGIQGNINSCYLDSLLMAMFSFTNVFDYLLYRKKNSNDIEFYCDIQELLLNIVNLLRDDEKFLVEKNHIMKFRDLFEKIIRKKGFVDSEKDPEEFLTLLINEVLKEEQFIQLRDGFTNTFTIFIEDQVESEQPYLQDLFKHSLIEYKQGFKKVPKCLIIQIPRYNKKERKFKRIYPSEEIDITNFLEDSPKYCNQCCKVAYYYCENCIKNINYEEQYFCKDHAENKKNKCIKRSHKIEAINYNNKVIDIIKLIRDEEVPTIKLSLFAVLCIETSHYVGFLKTGLNNNAPWVFSDSMSDRIHEENIPAITILDDLKRFIEKSYDDVKDKRFKELKNRLFTDGYLYFYQHVPSLYS